ncbi:hypothetical protein GCM10009845_14450 [Pedococcus bigeumensis]
MGGRGIWTRLVTATIVVAPLALVAVTGPATAATESETYLSYVSAPGDYVGQGRSGTLAAPTPFRISGTAGSVTVSADTGSEWWDVTLAAPTGQQLTTGSYENATRAPFNSTYGGLSVTSTGRGCNSVKGRFTIFAISADTAGRITSLDATLTQFCDNSTGSLSATVKYAAPYVITPVLTSANPSVVADQPVTLTARTSPGTASGVVFYDATTPIGQASFDANGTARLTTSRLTPGTHSLTARVGTATSAPLLQEVAVPDTSLWFGSLAGDYIGQGASASYVPTTATLTARGTAGYASISVDSPSTEQWWTLDVAAAPGETLQVGTYTGAVRAPFRGAGQPGLSFSGTGRGCNALTGDFTVNSIGTDAAGTVTSLDVTFRQYCDGASAAMSGRARFHTAPADPRAVSTTALSGSATSDGSVTLTATVQGGTAVPTGPVTFREGSSTLGTAALDTRGVASLVVPGLARGSHTLGADYGGSTTVQPSSGSTTVVVPGIATTTSLTVAKTVKTGKPVSVSVTVAAASGPRPTGTVRLYDGLDALGTATLVDGRASIVWTPVAKGNHTLTVRYLGSSTHLESVSPGTVVKAT